MNRKKQNRISIIMILGVIMSMVQVPLLATAQSIFNTPKDVVRSSEFNMIQLSCSRTPEGCQELMKDKEEVKDIVDIAVSDGRFKTLVTALKAADLVDKLKGEGPFTVFAPTDEAFSKLPAGTLDKLLKPESKDALVNILTFHVAPEKLLATDIMKMNGKEVTMANGSRAKIEVKDGSVYINGAKVISTDIKAKNGVIHVIDAVMIPPEKKM